jgi:hypothetical protein
VTAETGRIDLALEPLRYPGPAATEPMLVLSHCRHRVQLIPGRPPAEAEVIRCDACAARHGRRRLPLNEELQTHELVPIEQRVPVVAVGANAGPQVLRVKMDRTGGDPVIPLFPASVRNLRIGVSAHVSRPGFVPAAPARVDGALARVVIGWPDRDQLPRLDSTEPNYSRIELSSNDFPIRLDGEETWSRLPGFELYDSRWGVLAGPGGPWKLPSQIEICSWLGDLGLEPWRSQGPERAIAELAASESLRVELRRQFQRRGLVARSGLT